MEAGGQFIRDFRRGLDYAFNLREQVAERVIRLESNRILVFAQRTYACARRVYESLQGSPEVGPLATPRRCHTTKAVAQVSPM